MLHGTLALALVQAIKDAAQTIRKMPAHYITYPNSSEQIFKVTGKIKLAPKADSNLIIVEDFLWSFGEMQVPTSLWRAFSSFAAWLEPALLFEWSDLKWLDPARDTGPVRGLVLQMMAQNSQPLQCVWSGKALKADKFDVDHCFPFAAWPCNDLRI